MSGTFLRTGKDRDVSLEDVDNAKGHSFILRNVLLHYPFALL